MRATRLVLMASILVLAAGGIVMLASTSEPFALSQNRSPTFFLSRQAVWLGIAAIFCATAAFLDYRAWRWLAVPLFVVTALLLIVVLVPGLTKPIKGSRRWLNLGFLMFQPAELAKLSVVIFLAWWMRRAQRHIEYFWRGLAPGLAGVGFLLLLVLKEPDYGSTILLAIVAGTLLFAGGARLDHLLLLGVGGGGALTVLILNDPIRLKRITSFWEPLKYADKDAYQLVNSLEAFVVGGWSGVGLGAGLGKHLHLPEVHTDFILANIGEELGLFGTLTVLVLFLLIGLCGLNIARAAPDVFGRLLAIGLTVSIVAQAFVNIGVAIGSLPTTGLALPFISYGGSNLLVNAIMAGILLNISRHAVAAEDGEGESQPFKDRLRRV